MSDQVYFIGYRPEHFTGWDGTGSSSYTSVSASNSMDPNNVGSISLSKSGNVLWKDLTLTELEPVYFCINYGDNGGYNDDGYIFTPNSAIVITDGTNAIEISYQSATTNSSVVRYYKIIVDEGTYTTTNRFVSSKTLNSITTGTYNGTSGYCKFYFSISSSNNTTYDTIKVQYENGKDLGVIYDLYSGKIDNELSSIKSIYFPYLSSNTIFFYCAVANFDLTGAYVDYTNVASSGTFDGWSGTVSTLNTYPINSSVTANGVYSYSANDQITFSPTKQLTSGTGMMAPKAVFIDSSLSTNENNLGYSATSIVKNSSSSLTYSLGSAVTPSTTVTNYQWVSYQNPSNLSEWTVSDVNSLEFGLKRIS